MPIPGFEWIEQQAGVDVGTTRDMQFLSPSGVLDCPPDGGAPKLPPRGLDSTRVGATRMIFPPRVEKLHVSVDFNVNNYQLILPAGIGSTVVLPGFQVSQGFVGWLQEFVLYVLTPTQNTSATWQVRINQSPVPGFDNIQNPPGIANLILIGTDDMRIELPNSAFVDVLITNNNAFGPWTIGSGLSGWTHPEAAQRRAFGEANDL